jgi:hypothetical protein
MGGVELGGGQAQRFLVAQGFLPGHLIEQFAQFLPARLGSQGMERHVVTDVCKDGVKQEAESIAEI